MSEILHYWYSAKQHDHYVSRNFNTNVGQFYNDDNTTIYHIIKLPDGKIATMSTKIPKLTYCNFDDVVYVGEYASTDVSYEKAWGGYNNAKW